MSKKHTFNEIEVIINEKTNGKCKLINYISADVNMELTCKCGNKFSTLLSNFKKGKIYCNECLERIRKQKQFNNVVKFIHKCGNYVISKFSEYETEKSDLKILCKCGNIFKTTYKRYKHKNKRQCNDCGYAELNKMQKQSIEIVYELFRNKGLIPLFSEDDYKNVNTRLPYKCKTHINEDIQYITYASLSREEAIGCFLCKNEKLRGYFKEKNPREYFNEKGLIPLFENNEYINSYQILPFICKQHESYGIQKNTLTNVKYNNGCKFCSHSKSKGEDSIKEILRKFYNIKFSTQQGFSDCKHRIMLKFDFFIYKNDELKFIIEYDGIQHFEPQDFAGKGEKWASNVFKETQIKDNIKNKYCLDKNIPLVRIPYWDFENIKEILENVLGFLNLIEYDYNDDIVCKYLVNQNWFKSVV